MADYLPQSSTAGQPGRGHEANTLVVKGLIVFALALIAVTVFVEFGLVYVMTDFSQEEKLLQALAPPKFGDDSGPVPGPRLQATPPTDLVKLKEAELRRLNGYGWVDRNSGIAHVPIARAIDIVASKGLPAGGEPAEKNAEKAPPAEPAATANKSAVPPAKQGQKP